MVTRMCSGTGEALLTPERKSRKQGKRYKDDTKSAEGERGSERFIVAKKPGNSGGAKGPY